MQILGLDIGGANIKAATADGESGSVAFPLWRAPQELTAKLRSLRLLQNSHPDIRSWVLLVLCQYNVQ